jgi:hypothetical protein
VCPNLKLKRIAREQAIVTGSQWEIAFESVLLHPTTKPFPIAPGEKSRNPRVGLSRSILLEGERNRRWRDDGKILDILKITLRLPGIRGQLHKYGANRDGVTSSRARTDGKG